MVALRKHKWELEKMLFSSISDILNFQQVYLNLQITSWKWF